jgi:hypothetical protein
MRHRRIAYQRLAIAGLVSLGVVVGACGSEVTKPAVQSVGKEAARDAGRSYTKPAVGSGLGATGAAGTGCATTNAC